MKILGIISLILIILVAGITYAHGTFDEGKYQDWHNNMMEGFQSGQEHFMFKNVEEFDQEMDRMHEQMTANLDPETKKEMDEMHENCMSGFEDDKNNVNQEKTNHDEESMNNMMNNMFRR